MTNPAAVLYVAYIAAMGQKMRKNASRPSGTCGRTRPKGARLWDELPEDEQKAWWAVVRASVRCPDA